LELFTEPFKQTLKVSNLGPLMDRVFTLYGRVIVAAVNGEGKSISKSVVSGLASAITSKHFWSLLQILNELLFVTIPLS
jgi:hypothetical protein